MSARTPYQQRRHDYGVFMPNPQNDRAAWRWCRPRTKRAALALAKRYSGTVRAKIASDRAAWDAPTFRVCSEEIASFEAPR